MPLSNTKAIERIHSLLDDRSWDDPLMLLHTVVEIVRETGREIRNVDNLPTRWIIGNFGGFTGAWSDPDSSWTEPEFASTFSTSERETYPMPEFGFWTTPEELASLRGRNSQRLVEVCQRLNDWVRVNYLVEWRLIPIDERDDESEFVEIVWPSTAEHPQAITLRYSLMEAATLVNDLGRVRVRQPMSSEYTRRYGSLGELMARRVLFRNLSVPLSQRIADWDWAQEIDHHTFQHPRFYEDGPVVTGTYNGRTIRIDHEGRDEVRMWNAESDQWLPVHHTAREFREMMPLGVPDDDIEEYETSWFSIFDVGAGDSIRLDRAYNFNDALHYAALHLGQVQLP